MARSTWDVPWAGFCGFTAIVLLAASLGWHGLVDRTVPQPYLDEIFHVRQAQTYCEGDLKTWDPKITTPPGLYFISYVFRQVGVLCDIWTLRMLNVLFLTAGVFPLAFFYRSAWASSLSTSARNHMDGFITQRLVCDLHTALNVALFPPLFFFSGLYYTDVASTALVLAALALFKLRESYAHSASETLVQCLVSLIALNYAVKLQWPLMAIAGSAAYGLLLVLTPFRFDTSKGADAPPPKDANMRKFIWLVGAASLCFRQTNIFWVAVLPAGLSFLDMVRGRATSGSSWYGLMQDSAFSRTFFNPLVHHSSIQEFTAAVVSMASCLIGTGSFILSHPLSIQSKLIVNKLGPYLSLMMVFAVFVILNGGIVLGDKSNHIATIHLPQMLYIWPYMMFFSAPLILPGVVGSFLPSALRPGFLNKYTSPVKTSALAVGAAVATLAVAMVIVHFNTIVHPFTLADNRHYVFYVFRILRLRPELYYLAVPVYLVCAWAVLRTLGMVGNPGSKQVKRDEEKSVTNETSSAQGASVNFVVVWLATTALCLVGAPLVEPRYFILPWILWRLEVPSPQLPIMSSKAATIASNGTSSALHKADESVVKRQSKNAPKEEKKSESEAVTDDDVSYLSLFFSDERLWLETAWHLAINAVTGYVFLYRGFEWIQEPGEVQRFLW